MPTLDWLNRSAAFTTAACVPYRLLEPLSSHAPTTPAPAHAPSPLRGEGGGEGLRPHPNPSRSWWVNEDVGHNQESKKEINELFGSDNAFDTPKPERLLQRILHIATNENDLILGSGTTAAVAHKMGRRWIGIEMGEHAATQMAGQLDAVLA